MEDGLGGAVVLLEQDRSRVGVVLLELDDVADRRPAEGVDRLVGVTDDAQLARGHRVRGRVVGQGRADELLDELVLRDVGVLVLVDEDVAEASAVVLRGVGEGLEQVDGRHDEVVEVERVGLPQPPLVGGEPSATFWSCCEPDSAAVAAYVSSSMSSFLRLLTAWEKARDG